MVLTGRHKTQWKWCAGLIGRWRRGLCPERETKWGGAVVIQGRHGDVNKIHRVEGNGKETHEM